jgi:hypothetical protein
VEAQHLLSTSQSHYFASQQEEGLQRGIANLQQQAGPAPTGLGYYQIEHREAPESKQEQSIVAAAAHLAGHDMERNALQPRLLESMTSPASLSLFESSSNNLFRESTTFSTIPLPHARLPPRMRPMPKEPSIDEETSKHDWYASYE